MKKILIIDGHPDPSSYCAALAERYRKGAVENGSECRLVHLTDLAFNPILKHGYRLKTELEPDLLRMQRSISWAEHLVFVYPYWWGSYPALLKGFIDRTFLPQFAFRYKKDSPLWDKLLSPKTGQLIVTTDTPIWYYWMKYLGFGQRSMKTSILEFCGVKPVIVKLIGPVKSSTIEKREQWLKETEELGRHE